MNDDELRSLKPSQVLARLGNQVSIALDYFLADQARFIELPADDALAAGALIAIGDFLIYPRFSADREANPSPDRHTALNLGPGNPIEPAPTPGSGNLESPPALGSSPADLPRTAPECLDALKTLHTEPLSLARAIRELDIVKQYVQLSMHS